MSGPLWLQGHPYRLGHRHIHRHIAWTVVCAASFVPLNKAPQAFVERFRLHKETSVFDHASDDNRAGDRPLRAESVSSVFWSRLRTVLRRSGNVS